MASASGKNMSEPCSSSQVSGIPSKSLSSASFAKKAVVVELGFMPLASAFNFKQVDLVMVRRLPFGTDMESAVGSVPSVVKAIVAPAVALLIATEMLAAKL